MNTKIVQVLKVFIFYMAMISLLVYSGAAFAEATNPEGDIMNETLKGDPDCINNGEIKISEDRKSGMYVEGKKTDEEDKPVATNNGVIITSGERGYGMHTYYYSKALNYGYINTSGIEGHGMYAHYNAEAHNYGYVKTCGYRSYGMYAYYDKSEAHNHGSIVTSGEEALGMRAYFNSKAYNNFRIVTSGKNAEGMYASNNSEAVNNGIILARGVGGYGIKVQNYSSAINNRNIVTSGDFGNGMDAYNDSDICNNGNIVTSGNESHGMSAWKDSEAINDGNITTFGNKSRGMDTWWDSEGTNKGNITTSGKNGYGMYADKNSNIHNDGKVETSGEVAYGMYAKNKSSAENREKITTSGESAHGMYLVEKSTGTNEGNITVTGADADAVHIDDSTFTNTGILFSLNGNAITAKDDSKVNLFDGTRLHSSKRVIGDGSSILTVDMSEDLEAIIKDFGTFTKNGTGTLTLQYGSTAGATYNNAGTLKIAPDTTFETNYYKQTSNASLHFYVPSNPDVGPPLKVNNKGGDPAEFAGNVIIDYSSQPLPGRYKYIHVCGERIGYFNTVSYINPGGIYAEEATVWEKEDDNWYYMNDVNNAHIDEEDVVEDTNGDTGSTDDEEDVVEDTNDDTGSTDDEEDVVEDTNGDTGSTDNGGYIDVNYSFSEQALGLVSAIEDWSLLRWIMANHLQDVMDEMDKLEKGEKVFYSHFFGSKTDRNPAGSSPLGFEAKTKGLSFGFDQKVNDTTIWGMYAGYTEKDIDFTNVFPASSDWEEQDTWHLGAYMSKRFDRWVISDTLTYRSTDHNSFRRQIDGDARASFDSWAITNDIRVGYMMSEIGENSKWEIVPEIGINVGYFERDGYRESNGYTYGDYDTTVVEGLIGVRLKGKYLSEDGSRFVPHLRLSYVKVLSGDDVTIDQTCRGNTKWFTEELDDYYFVTDLGMSLYRSNGFGMSLNYTGRFGDNSDSHGGWLRLDWKL